MHLNFPIFPPTLHLLLIAKESCHSCINCLLNSSALIHRFALWIPPSIPVCKLARADDHKVALGIAQFGKNHQGWHYGFKLHASIDLKGRLCGIALTPANVYDAQMIPKILNERARVAVGDSHYGASVMRQHIWETYGTIIIAPPHFKQKRKAMAKWQYLLLTMRPKVESVFDYLKEHLHLVTSFPRSVKGYLLHYLRILLGYQLLVM